MAYYTTLTVTGGMGTIHLGAVRPMRRGEAEHTCQPEDHTTHTSLRMVHTSMVACLRGWQLLLLTLSRCLFRRLMDPAEQPQDTCKRHTPLRMEFMGMVMGLTTRRLAR